ncbi:putative uncharacterized protein DDB_G0286901 [Hyla sarda]|uniref:putative uncharacterized protein DDB_G0286901 n=1 Tax=Hyla sarda TaxID=327740 RepID=UPI0024C23F45|nr:putative uncharacterized protein DDB_G0286901 [Hyla sarda]
MSYIGNSAGSFLGNVPNIVSGWTSPVNVRPVFQPPFNNSSNWVRPQPPHRPHHTSTHPNNWNNGWNNGSNNGWNNGSNNGWNNGYGNGRPSFNSGYRY